MESTYDRVPQDDEANSKDPSASAGEFVSDTVPRHGPASKHQWIHRVSLTTGASVVAASVAMPVVMSFLVFLWSQPDGGIANSSWRRIVVHDLVIKSITVSALILRTAVSIQASTAVSMVASVLLERSSVPIHACASLSTMRHVNGGPYDLITTMAGLAMKNKLLAMAVTVLLTTTTLLQFTSTILAADLGYGTLITSLERTSSLGALSLGSPFNVSRDSRFNYWTFQPRDFPTFGERIESENSTGDQEGMVDTGTVLRAFLPIYNSSERTAIQRFEGRATVLDLRVVCVRPKIDPYLSIGYTVETGFMLNGTLSPMTSPQGLINSDGWADVRESSNSIQYEDVDANNTVDFTWMQRLPYMHPDGWPIIQKVMSTDAPALVSALDPRYPQIISNDSLEYAADNINSQPGTLKFYLPGDPVPLMTGGSFLIFNLSLSNNLPMLNTGVNDASRGFLFSQDSGDNKLTIATNNEWLKLSIAKIPKWSMDITLCFDSIRSVDANVTIVSENVVKEPSMGAFNDRTNRFDTTELRRQLTIRADTYQNRTGQVMRLLNTSDELRKQIQPWYEESKENGSDDISWPCQNFVSRKIRGSSTQGINMCTACGVDWPLYPNGMGVSTYQVENDAFQNSIFHSTATYTGSIAAALQAYYTSIARTVYYSIFPWFDDSRPLALSRFDVYQFPRSHAGLIAVGVTLCVHFVLCVSVAAAFFARTTITRLGDNAWQCIAQVSNSAPEVRKILESSTDVKDKIVKEMVEAAGLHEDVVRLGLVQSSSGADVPGVPGYGLVLRSRRHGSF